VSWSESKARARFESASVAVLATVSADGEPHLVPIVFALDGDRIVSGVDHKPKSTMALQRLANIAGNDRVSLLVDHYEEEWTHLWWARADGAAGVIQPDDERHGSAANLLADRYPQYHQHPISGPIIEIRIDRWSDWSA
jgi:PPOX class probable F420-dependent enzyme